MADSSLPSDWERSVLRAYEIFSIDPLDGDSLGGADEFGFFGKLSPEFLKKKAEEQLRDPEGKFRQVRARMKIGGKDKGGGKVADINAPELPAKKLKIVSDAPKLPSKEPAVAAPPKKGGIPDPPKAYEGWPRSVDGRVIMDWDNVMKWMDGAHHAGKHSLLEHIEDSVDHLGNPVKVLSKEREAVHQELVRKTLEGIRPVPLGEKLRALFLGGGPGAGKTTATKQLEDFPDARALPDYEKRPPGDAAMIAADDYKMALPDWNKWDPASAGGYAHNESLLIADAARDAAIKGRLNMVVDGTGDGGEDIVREKIASAQSAGYTAEGVYVTVPTDEAMVRALTRGLETGRNLSLHHLWLTHKGVSRDVNTLLKEKEKVGYDNFDLFDSDVGLTDEPIPIIENGKIVNLKKYDDFIKKMDESKAELFDHALERARDPKRKFRETGNLSADEVRSSVIAMLEEEKRVLDG